MPVIQWSLDIGDVVITLIALVFIPVTKLLIRTLYAVREAVQELTIAVFGTKQDPSIGMVAHIAELRKETVRHRNWLTRLSAETGSKIEERS